MVHVVVRIVGFVGIPDAGEQIALPGHRTTLHMNAVDEAMLDVGSAPVAAPDQAAALCELSQKSEIAFPAGFATDQANNIAGQSVVVDADGSEFGSSAIEQFLLTVLAAIGFIDHDLNSHSLGGGNQPFHQLPRHRFEQGSVGNADG